MPRLAIVDRTQLGKRMGFWFLASLIAVATPSWAPAEDLLEGASDPGPNRPGEPVAKEFSMDQAVSFLDRASLHWQKQRKCFTCHTNYAYLYARPLVKASAEHAVVRQFAEDLVTRRWKDKGPRWDAEVVATAAALAFNDRATTGKLHATTRTALDRMWTLQRNDGGWNWLKCGWPPMESDDDYGVVLAALAASVAPEAYAKTPQAAAGMKKLRKYLDEHPGPTLHHRAMLLWAASYDKTLMPAAARQQCRQELLQLQRKDGGWSLASLGNWERLDGEEQDVDLSDGYGTGFVAYVLLRDGVQPDADPIRRAVGWLKTHQRESGRWFTRSLNTDNKHYISHAGTAMAVMALQTAAAGGQ